MAFAFGLLHGLGFASALAEIGLPDTDVAVALLGFNTGIEFGQLILIGSLVAAGRTLRGLRARLGPESTSAVWPEWSTAGGRRVRRLVVYGIGTLSAYWCMGRVLMLV